MATLFLDGCQNYTFNTSLQKWGTFNASLSASGSPYGDQCIAASAGQDFSKSFSARASYIWGFRFKMTTYPSSRTTITSLKTVYGPGDNQVSLKVNPAGLLEVWTADGSGVGTLLGSGSTVVPPESWTYIEVKATVDNSSGAVSVRINSAADITLTSVDTQAPSTNPAGEIIWFGSPVTGPTFSYTDIYICDTTTALCNDFLSDLKVITLYPSGAGTTTQWTPSAGNNYAAVDEPDPNGDTDYVSTGTLNNIDTYAFGNLPGAGSVKSIQHFVSARKENAGAINIASMVRHSGSNYASSGKAVSSGYSGLLYVYDANPGTSAAWVDTAVDAAEFGIKLV
jgi:hypothetical protein